MEERKLEYRETADFKVIENTLLLVGKLSDTRNKVKAMEILRDAFAKELGAMADKWVYDEPKPDVYVKFVNPKDEGFLYPHLAVLLKEAVLKKCRQDRKERVLSYIDAFMELWKEGRSNQASQEQQKRPQEATNGYTPTIAQQEQKAASEPKELKDLLPDELKTDEAVKVFQRAIDRGLMRKTATGLEWLQIGVKGRRAHLAYLCGRIYCGDEIGWDNSSKMHKLIRGMGLFPNVHLKKLFGIDGLDGSRRQIGFLNKGYQEIDKLFEAI